MLFRKPGTRVVAMLLDTTATVAGIPHNVEIKVTATKGGKGHVPRYTVSTRFGDVTLEDVVLNHEDAMGEFHTQCRIYLQALGN